MVLADVNGDHENEAGNRTLQFVPATGSLIGGPQKDKLARITDAMIDLQIVIDGARSQLDRASEGKLWTQAMGAFARACSIFLRKTVLGNRGQRETRLLDDRILAITRLRFDRLRKIPRECRRTIEVGLHHSGASLIATRLDERTHDPEETHVLSAAPQEEKLFIEWPLPGVADWTAVPSSEAPWPVNASQLFQQDPASRLSCDQWLGQQVVLFDKKPVSLKKMIQTVVNYDGAHSINVGRLSTPAGHTPSKAAKDPAPHILNAVTFSGHRYLDLIVIECAMYVYEKLLHAEPITRPLGDIYSFGFGVTCSPEQAESHRPDWATFQGTMMVSFSGVPTVVSHEIKAVS